MSALLALDLGTTSVRALVVDLEEGVVGAAARPLTTRFPPAAGGARVEQDAAEMWERSVEVLREALAGSGRDAAAIGGLGVVSQRASVVAWSGDGKPLAPVLSWQDQRTAERVAGLRAQGIPITAQASATKLEWWMQEDEAVAAAARAGALRLGTPDAWLTWCLTAGVAHATEPGCASCTGLFDAGSDAFSEGICGLFSVPVEALPAVVDTNATVGETPASLLGAPVPVAARAGDQQASAFAQGVHAPGDAKLTLGTSAMLDLHTGDTPAGFEGGTVPLSLWRLALPDGATERAFCREGSVTTAGAAVDWLASLGIARDGAEVDRLAASVPDSAGVAFVPALQGLGSPWVDDTARGLLGGLTRGAGRAHLARAVLEGIAHRCADLVECVGVEADTLPVDGGLARSDVLLQAIADFSGVAVERSAQLETTALGAAFLAGLGRGALAEPAACAARIGRDARFEPQLGARARSAARERQAEVVARARG